MNYEDLEILSLYIYNNIYENKEVMNTFNITNVIDQENFSKYITIMMILKLFTFENILKSLKN